jgi:hypothetical protein
MSDNFTLPPKMTSEAFEALMWVAVGIQFWFDCERVPRT